MSSAISVLLLFLSAPASAQTPDPVYQDDLDRAAGYWNAKPVCGFAWVRYDQAFVDENLGYAEACTIWIGDKFLALPPAQKCQTITHEWGHLTGHGHVIGLPDDPVGVMVSYALPPACAALEPPVPAAPPVPVLPPASPPTQVDMAYQARAVQRLSRANCTVTANTLAHRKARVRARARCVKKYGPIWASSNPRQ